MTTTCIGCGCDDHNSCDDFIAGCHWLVLDIDKGIGVCSACPELLERWDGGLRKPDPEFTELRVQDLLKDLYPAGDALVWYQSPQKLLEGKSPHEHVAAGDVRRVRQIIDQMRDGAFI